MEAQAKEESDGQPLKVRKTASMDSGNEASSEDSNDSTGKAVDATEGVLAAPELIKEENDVECNWQTVINWLIAFDFIIYFSS